MTRKPEEDGKSLGQKIREAREAAPLNKQERARKNRTESYPTQEEMADRIPMDRTLYSRIENNRRKPTRAQAARLEKELSVPAGEFHPVRQTSVERTLDEHERRMDGIEQTLVAIQAALTRLEGPHQDDPSSQRGRRAGSRR